MQYVDYAIGKESGFLRFADPEDAQKLREAAALEPKGGLTIANHLVTFEALEGKLSKILLFFAFVLINELHVW